jgi:two-component system chemotaxis sensor kinase CheA
MPAKDKDFQAKLLATFRVEAAEHIEALSSGLMELERSPGAEKRGSVVEAVFREVHSLKGAARAVGLIEIERICQSAETVFSDVQRGELELSQPLLDLLHEVADALDALLRAAPVEAGGKEAVRISGLLDRLAGVLEARPPRAGVEAEPSELGRAAPPDQPAVASTVRISTARLDALLFQAEELLSAKLGASQHAADLRAAAIAHAAWRRERGRKVRKLPQFREWEEQFVKAFDAKLAALAQSAAQAQRTLGAMVDGLLEDVRKARMLPAASALASLPKIVRDLCRDRGKEAELAVRGADIEIDRRILEELRDPLLHLLRNCIDHGIEPPEERKRKGKPPRGAIGLALTRKSEATIEIVVSDDGAGIDAGRLAEAALKLGIVSRAQIEGRDARELLPLVFHSGISTSPAITEISGRGLGLAIVREKAERLGGSVAVEAEPERGTSFRVVVPLTLATFRGVQVRLGDRHFVIPTSFVEQVLRLRQGEIRTVENRETIRWDGRAVALAHLADVLGLPRGKPADASSANVQLVIAGSPEQRIAFLVDEVLEEREVLVKPLGKQLVRVRNIAGAAVLGSGALVPVLDVPDLLRSAAKPAARPLGAERTKEQRKAVLVAEDSITSRTLLKTILEAAGYAVGTAVDGVDALTALKTQRFDAVVSDVDMPRMNGFELTAKIRADSALSALPVVLVTSLESREHREKGVDAGANAYIVKSSFDQSNLLATLRRLL